MLLGPRCNHDLGVLLRLPVSCVREVFSYLDDGGVQGTADSSAIATASSAMLEAMGDHEYYCASYSGKEQPHVEGLLVTLTDSLRAKEQDLARARHAGENLDGHAIAKSILHRLQSGMNRRMHKGFPEMLTYLLRRPMEYCSHEFVHVVIAGYIRSGLRDIYACCGRLDAARDVERDNGVLRVASTPTLLPIDYPFRPLQLVKFPLYFFLAGCRVVTTLDRKSMNWYGELATKQRSYCPDPVMSKSHPGLPLLDENDQPFYKYAFHVQLLTHSAWCVPVLHGKLPAVATESSTPTEKRYYALVLLLLFYPYRSFRTDVLEGLHLDASMDDDAVSLRVWDAFSVWRKCLQERARPFLSRTSSEPVCHPEVNSDDWWACVICERLRNYEAAKQRHIQDAFSIPTDDNELPEYADVPGGGAHENDVTDRMRLEGESDIARV